ncbi:MAG: hypothetical protein ABEL04_11445, partial [Salinibacter sp.]
LLLPLIPAALVAPSVGALALLWGLGSALVVVSVSAGVAVGQYTTSRARGLMAALGVWFVAFALYDTLALVGAGVEVLQGVPMLWVGLLLLNPVDAVRLAGLFGLENVPFSAPGKAAWIAELTAWLPAWVAVLAVAWTALVLTLACRRLRRTDL